MVNKFDLLIDGFLENNIGQDIHFLSPALSKGLQENISRLRDNNQLTKAGIGNGAIKDADQKMRGDEIYWLDKQNQDPFEQEFLDQVEDFISHLNRTCYTGIESYEFHYAVYPAGTFYRRHKDQFRNDSKRKFSLISYLNTDWSQADGGELHLYNGDQSTIIQPRAQTAVLFKSDEMEHEVMETNCPRMSISGWLKCR